MATAADQTQTAKADAAAEKAYAAAADAVSPKKADTPKLAAPKIEAAVAEVKAAPKPAKKPARKAKRAAAKTVAATKTAVARAPKPAAAKKPAAPIKNVSNLKDRIMTTDFTTTIKETTAQAQTRAKAAYDRMQGYTGEMTEFTKGNVEALVESGKILGTGLQEMARTEIEAAKGAFETVTADLKAMAAVKSPTDLFKLQGEIARRNFDAMVARASQNAEVSMKLANDVLAPLSSRMSLVTERFSKAA